MNNLDYGYSMLIVTFLSVAEKPYLPLLKGCQNMFRAFSIQGEYNIEEMNNEWYIDKNYKNLALLEGKKIGVLY